ncbi:acyl-CoA hydrolase [Jeotgalibacillus alimentarius]|uniref:Acyl-CoA hydrolase n=2 Tax=Jeotgalibacillus alimentarius TaxID=135826 RepID=A0A0C2VRS0_9BACL|nr:acyl-CoA hydrolase [Jeotgalibacillus alimentarius]
MMNMTGKPVSDSRTVQTRLVLPPDTNHLNTIFGGKVLAYIDEMAALSAMKHAGGVVVTASIDSVHFRSSAKVGDLLTLESFVTYTGKTSMEVYVKVEVEHVATGDRTLTTESFLTMVAVDSDGDPKDVVPVLPESKEEIELYESARVRRLNRKR